jgi:ABC-type dipeptide/oligopeptide/nickel transport system permease subunit
MSNMTNDAAQTPIERPLLPPDASAGSSTVSDRRSRSFWEDAARTFVHNIAGMAGLVVIVLLLVIAIFAPKIAPYNYLTQNYTQLLQGPSSQHLMGTDELGRDLFSRVIISLRTGVTVATLITLFTGVIGFIVGAAGALAGSIFDAAVVWVTDALLSIPALWFAAFISVATRPTIEKWVASLATATHWGIFTTADAADYAVVVFCLGLVSWPGLARIVRGQVLALRQRDFIQAERALGATNWWIVRKHLLPNVLGQVIVTLSVTFGFSLLLEASLSFLGIGIRPPGASLGQMIADGVTRYRSAPYLVAMPGLVLALIVLAFNFVGDALNDALNPQARQR